MTPARIRDVVDVRPHPTVVKLEHLDRPDAAWISDAYFPTADARKHLAAIREALIRDTSLGAFVIGQYGAGKSHFLAYLAQQVRAGHMGPAGLHVVPISLLHFPSHVALERIVAQSLGIDPQAEDRRAAWDTLDRTHPGGTVLLLDELSEFLRSKPEPSAFHEDVRFLQFLGERTDGRRLWVIAAMQETIEHTGTLEKGQYRKLKDRYPLRLMLTPAHVRDLISRSILVKKPGYESAASTLATSMERALAGAGIQASALVDIVPLHPATLDLLGEVRDSFSQARGVVDFAVKQLAGDPTRGIEPFLDRPWGDFITPDVIVDHFHDLLVLQPEFQDIAAQVLPYYDVALERLFDKPARRALASRVLRLLILCRLAPARDSLTPAQAAAWLMLAVAKTHPEQNVEIMRQILETLATHGRYVTSAGGAFALDLRDDGATQFERMVAAGLAELAGDDESLLSSLTPLLAGDTFNPFELPEGQWQSRLVRWHRHDRRFFVMLGDGDVPPNDDVSLCVRTPWGGAGAHHDVYTVLPAPIELDPALRELCVLQRLRQTPATREVRARIDKRLLERLELLRSRVRDAYASGHVVTPRGIRERAFPVDASTRLAGWLEQHALWMLRQRFPKFEMFAPEQGPLSKDAYVRTWRYALQQDLTVPAPDPVVRAVQDGYLVPMKLLQRVGNGYRVPVRLDRHELVGPVLALAQHAPSPSRVYESMADSVHGLLPDQTGVLLLFLVARGELEITRSGTSIREGFETLPKPDAWDRVAIGLPVDQQTLRDLEELLDGLGIHAPKPSTVASQRAAVQRIRAFGETQRKRLEPLVERLRGTARAEAIADTAAVVLAHWRVLLDNDDELSALRRFLFEIGSVGRFLAASARLAELPDRVDLLFMESERLDRLLNHPHVVQWPSAAVREELARVGPPPQDGLLDGLEGWLQRARAAYAAYQADYARLHDTYWSERRNDPAWDWKPPPVARSRHVGAAHLLEQHDRARSRVDQARCRELTNTDYHPRCACGFDGTRAPGENDLIELRSLRDRIEEAITGFFAQEPIRRRLARWREEGLEVRSGTIDWLEGRAPFPDIPDVDQLDRFLGGANLLRKVAVEQIVRAIAGRTWSRAELLDAVAQVVGTASEPIVVEPPAGNLLPSIATWCMEQSLRSATALPAGWESVVSDDAVAAVDLALATDESLAKVERLNLPDRLVDRLVRAGLDGALRVTGQTGLARAISEVVQPSTPRDPAELAVVVHELYRHHHRFSRIDPRRWLARLDQVAGLRWESAIPALGDVLETHRSAAWLVIDAFGLPLLPVRDRLLAALLPGLAVTSQSFARVEVSTTAGLFDSLLESGFARQVEKVNAIDTLLHERFAPLDDLVALIEAELRLASRALAKRIDWSKPLVVFADHGFRIARDGRSYAHGGSSVLECTVPVIVMQPGR
jgi:hypothetical protein